ncbi:anaphase-promoting complex subunit 4-like [Diadema antillarum]|uniref:anaphase-promoting complex subunit 4-like n=1 Tax=Diadema antillarum TaxID=105358 RepID=UPI003A87D7B6
MQQAFRQLEERNLSVEVTLMEWSPKMDLIALSNENGEVLLQRLTWQRQPIWTLSPPGEEERKEVRALAWRPDGKVLAVGYSSGKLILCSVEKAEVIHTANIDQPITTMQWTSAVDTGPNLETTGQQSSITAKIAAFSASSEDGAEKFLPKLPSLSKISSIKTYIDDNVENAKRLKEQKKLNMLIIGASSGQLTLLAYGVAPVASLEVSHFIPTLKCGDIVGASLSADLHTLSVVVEHSNEDDITEIYQTMLTMNCVLLASRHQEISRYAMKFGKIRTLMEYLEATLKAVTEAKEDILIEMETKLTKYAQQKKVSEGSLSDEFLQLLLWGKASLELQEFLVNDLTEKGLKKLDQSVENSYVSIQKLVLKHIHSVGRSLLFHLSELKGMALWYDKYGMLGLSATAIQDAMSAVGSFMLKANELLQVIEHSLKNFKAFFRWLYVVLMQLLEEPIQQSVSRMYQRDINFVADFLTENFTDEPSLEGTKSGFTLERVGQYLRKENLQFPVNSAPDSWQDLVNATPSLRESDLLFPWQREKSLSQLHDLVKERVDHALSRPPHVGGESLTCRESHRLDHRSETDDQEHWIFSQQGNQDLGILYTVKSVAPSPTKSIHLTRQYAKPDRTKDHTDIVALNFGSLGSSDPDESIVSLAADSHLVLDAAFYGDHSLSILLQEVKEDGAGGSPKPVLCQLSLEALQGQADFTPLSEVKGHLSEVTNLPTFDAGPLVMFRRMDNMRACRLAVSGSRKVACVLFSNQRRVRLFDMDAEDEGEDEDDEEEAELDDSSMLVAEDTSNADD